MVFLLVSHRRLALSLHLPHSVNSYLSHRDVSHSERGILKVYTEDIRRRGRCRKGREGKGETRCKKEGEFWVKPYHIHVRKNVKKMSWVTGQTPEHVCGLGRCGTHPRDTSICQLRVG